MRRSSSIPDSKKAAQWRRHLAAAAAAPSITAYCREAGVSTALFHYWRRRLSPCKPLGRRRAQKFVRLEVAPAATAPAMAAVDEAGGLSMRLPGGLVVEAASARCLAELVRLLGAGGQR